MIEGPIAQANDGYKFKQWSDGYTSALYTGQIGNYDQTIIAEFESLSQEYTVHVTIESPEGTNYSTSTAKFGSTYEYTVSGVYQGKYSYVDGTMTHKGSSQQLIYGSPARIYGVEADIYINLRYN